MSSRYMELGLELIELGEEHPRQSKKPPIAGKMKDDEVGDPIKLLLEETVA
jgi:hypothetical protein